MKNYYLVIEMTSNLTGHSTGVQGIYVKRETALRIATKYNNQVIDNMNSHDYEKRIPFYMVAESSENDLLSCRETRNKMRRNQTGKVMYYYFHQLHESHIA